MCLLPADSEDVVSNFTKPAEVVGNKLGEHEFLLGTETGVPILDRSVAWFECRVVEGYQVGDNIQYVGEVVHGGVRSDEPAWTLQQLGWEYGG